MALFLFASAVVFFGLMFFSSGISFENTSFLIWSKLLKDYRQGLWKSGLLKFVLIFHYTHTHMYVFLLRGAGRLFPAVTVFIGISHSGVEWLLEGSGIGDGAAVSQREGRPASL